MENYRKAYAVLCAAASEVLDELPWGPETAQVRVRLQKALEQERIEAEKERIRAERRAANPDGITANTSKKKLEKQQRDQEQAAKAAAAKEYAARKGIVEEVAQEENAPLSGVSERPFCKGRNYDPDRYAPKSMEE